MIRGRVRLVKATSVSRVACKGGVRHCEEELVLCCVTRADKKKGKTSKAEQQPVASVMSVVAIQHPSKTCAGHQHVKQQVLVAKVSQKFCESASISWRNVQGVFFRYAARYVVAMSQDEGAFCWKLLPTGFLTPCPSRS